MARNYHALLKALDGSSHNNRPLNLAMMDENVQRLRDVRKRSATDDLQNGPPQCKVRVVGDPEIFDAQGRYYHYYGPSLLVNLDDRGMVRSLEFVGVRSDNDYISDVWHLDVNTGKYKYRDLSHMQGVSSSSGISLQATDEPQFQAGDSSWASEVEPDAVPPRAFFQKFKSDSETFFVDCRSGMFVLGPRYGLLKTALEHSATLVKSLFTSCSMDADVWMQEAADAIKRNRSETGTFSQPCRVMRMVQVAQLVYGLAACRVAVAG